MKSHVIISFLIVLLFSTKLFSQPKDASKYLIDKIKNEQRRIDLIDSVSDNKVKLESTEISDKIQQLIFYKVKDLTKLVETREKDYKTKLLKLECIYKILSRIDAENITFVSQYESQINLANKCMIEQDLEKLFPAMTANPSNSLKILPFYFNNNLTGDFLLRILRVTPTEVLSHFKEISEKQYADTVLLEIVKYAPGEVKGYMYSHNTVSAKIKNSSNKWFVAFAKIYSEKGMKSRSFTMLDDICNIKMTIAIAEQISSNPSSYIKYLSEAIGRKSNIAKYTIEKELQELCLKQVRAINDLHEQKDEVRFASTSSLTANEIYYLIVLGESEIYTSTFIGLYNRFNSKLIDSTVYDFLENQNWYKFRTFIKMCASYNTLNNILEKLKPEQKNRIFRKFCEGLEDNYGSLENAVIVADTYGNLKDDATKKQLEKLITNYFYLVTGKGNFEASKLYELLLEVISGKNNPNAIAFSSVSQSQLFKNDTCYEELMFYDDDDGKYSFISFIETYKKPEWIIENFENYVKISPKKGKQIIIYANKPEKEAEGQKDIKDTLNKLKRTASIVVHRGHSYYAWATIESLNPDVRIVVLGSCGGFNNISKVLLISPESHIISSKQIGTMAVNNEVIYQMNEFLRLGKNIDWAELWTTIEKKFGKNKEALSKFKDYIPPHQNLGALFIKTYLQRI
ncbi:MAG: hypothetical protein HUU47_09370 [Bacteroidetes bacterium]|nr:hypothetical protein [Bacteroidota bacterium]